MNSPSWRESLKLALILLWLVFTVVFALWWFKFSMENIELLARLEPTQLEHWARQRRMIFWEGSSWIVLLVLGGLALIGLMLRERARVRQIREFFASFSHEVKTSLASLRVQAEALQDDLAEHSSPVLTRLIGDTVRLHLQLENSLFFASPDSLRLFVKPLALNLVVERLREQWPTLKLNLQNACVLDADERALRTVFSNLVQNSIVHGQATEVSISARSNGLDRVTLRLTDNGRGFDGELAQLGGVFHRPKSNSGSGLGLYICKTLVQRMEGELRFLALPNGFGVELDLKGRLS